MRVCVCLCFVCVTEVSSCMVIKPENGRLLRPAAPLGSSYTSSPDKELFGHLLRAELRLVRAAGGGQGVWWGQQRPAVT